MYTHASTQSQQAEISFQLRELLVSGGKKPKAFSLFFLMISSAIKRQSHIYSYSTNLSKSTEFDNTTCI